ncbi:hypothetical protein [Alloalcanivorax profundimaris]|uniref:hypothetical protein n=1 Tax=Alloalcanivorax profundimaris TaxID=2735259 RepID=UPI00136DAAF4|nr:hypothetical protein [Alloalcanivorax profundimaris]MBM1145112.1 hypothetical protein [Alcanivorax sp. ZXX171]
MGLFDKLIGGSKGDSENRRGVIDSGRNKNTGGHDHRTNTGDDRTPSQKEGDKKRKKIKT